MVNLSEIVQVKQFKISSSELIKVRKIDLNQDSYHALFLGSMLPQYMALCVRYVCFVTSKKKFSHRRSARIKKLM